MTRIIKAILCFALLALADITKPVRAQTVRGVWVNANRTDLHGRVSHFRSAKKGNTFLSARSLDSPTTTSSKSSKKQALKLAKKSGAPINGFQPHNRLVAPTTVASPNKFVLTPTILVDTSKSSDIPSDAPSLVPTIGWAKPPTVLVTNDKTDEIDETPTAPYNVQGDRHFDIGPTNGRKRMLAQDAPTKTPTTQVPTEHPTTMEPSEAPTTGSSALEEGDPVTSTDHYPSGFTLPTPSFILVVLAAGIAAMATFLENRRRTERSPHEGVVEEGAQEGQFVNN